MSFHMTCTLRCFTRPAIRVRVSSTLLWDLWDHFILQLAEMKRSTKHLHVVALEFETTYQQKFQ